MKTPHRRNPMGQDPVVSVQKIHLDPVSAPVETPGKPVTGLQQVRLIHNMIVPDEKKGSRLIPRGEIVDISLVAEKWRTDQYIEAVDAFREGKIMMLHDFTCCVPSFDGESTVWREKLFSAYSLVDPASIPNRVMEGLIEGQDFLSEWDEERRKKQEIERQNAVEEFSMNDPEIPDGYRENIHLPYSSL